MESAATSPDESHGWRDERLRFGKGCVCGSLAGETRTLNIRKVYYIVGDWDVSI